MITRFATLTSRMAATLTMLFAIVACGGGGGGGGGGFLGEGGGENTDTLYLTVALKDPDGNPTSTVSSNAPGTLQVLVTRNGAGGAPVADIIVNASTDSGLLFPSSGSKLTNGEGLVTFRVDAGDAARGAGTIAVSVTDDAGVEVTESINFQIGVNNLRIGYLLDGEFFESEIGILPNEIAAKGEAILALAIVDENDLTVGSSESIRISSDCLTVGDAALSAENPIAVIDGRVQVTYSANGCSGTDALTAEIVGENAQAFGTVTIADPSADSITFVSAEPNLIVLKGTGGGPDRQEQSRVTFQTVDSEGTPQEGVEVRFALTTDVGGIIISPESDVSDQDGKVETNIFSGNVATVVRVIATMDASSGDGELSTVSDVLTISTGLPDQNSISLSVGGSFVVEEAMTKDGVTRCVTVAMADKFNNPVPNGTAAIFTTEYGAIDPSCETGRTNGDRASLAGCPAPTNGRCSVAWISQAPRFPTLGENRELVVTINDPGYSCPSHSGSSGPCPDDLGMINGGRSTIVVTAIGEESFIDSNANGIYDQGEKWENITEAWIDHNENGLYDPATTSCINNDSQLTCRAGSEEEFADFNSNGVFDANGDDPDNGYPDEGVTALYNGLLCPEEGDGDWCSRELLNVFGMLGVILSADPDWDIALYRGRTPVSPSPGTSFNVEYTAYVSDIFNNKPTAGSTIAVEASAPCTATILGNNTVPNTTAPGAFPVTFIQEGEVEYDSCTEDAPTGSDLKGDIKITLTPNAGGPSYSESWSCTAKATDTKDGDCPEDGGPG